MNSALRIAAGILCALCTIAVHAERNSKQRVAAFAKLPDWSGVWERFNVGPSDAPSDPKELTEFEAAYNDLRLPYNTEWQAKHDAEVLHRRHAAQPRALCQPLGFPEAMIFPSDMMQALVAPDETTLVFYSGGVRHMACAISRPMDGAIHRRTNAGGRCGATRLDIGREKF